MSWQLLKLKSCRTLIISEYDDSASLIKATLEDAGIRTISIAKHINIGLEKFKSGNYNLVLVDCTNFSSSLLHKVKEMRDIEAQKRSEMCSIVVMSSNLPEKLVKKSVENGISYLIQKPFSSTALNRRVEYSVQNPIPQIRDLSPPPTTRGIYQVESYYEKSKLHNKHK